VCVCTVAQVVVREGGCGASHATPLLFPVLCAACRLVVVWMITRTHAHASNRGIDLLAGGRVKSTNRKDAESKNVYINLLIKVPTTLLLITIASVCEQWRCMAGTVIGIGIACAPAAAAPAQWATQKRAPPCTPAVGHAEASTSLHASRQPQPPYHHRPHRGTQSLPLIYRPYH
jgi:hypothetical protein